MGSATGHVSGMLLRSRTETGLRVGSGATCPRHLPHRMGATEPKETTAMRSTPIRRRTPMKRSGKLKPVSDKRQDQNAEYIRLNRLFLAEHPRCQKCGDPSNQIHHKAGREGEWLTYSPFFMACCAPCHRFIEDNKTEAEKLGYIIRIYVTFKDFIQQQQSA